MIELGVGGQYPLPLQHTAGAAANFLTDSGNILQIIIPKISDDDLFSLKKGKIKGGFLYKNGDLLWLFTFYLKKQAIFTLDAPFDARKIPADLIALHSITNDRQRLAIEIHVIDENNIIKVLRMVTLSTDLTVEFMSAVQDQLTSVERNVVMQNWMTFNPDKLTKMTKMHDLGK